MNTASPVSKVAVGLGNPTEQYANTYHNVGQIALEYFSGSDAAPWKTPRARHFSYRKANNLILVKPTTFMNESGNAVAEALEYFNATPGQLIVVHDDSDISLGNHKFSFESGSAGHKGVESIITVLGTNKFLRLRIGIRLPQETRRAEAFVLRRVTKSGRELLEGVLQRAARELEALSKTRRFER